MKESLAPDGFAWIVRAVKYIAALGLAMIAAAVVAGSVAQAQNVAAPWTASFSAAGLVWMVEAVAIALVVRAPVGPQRVTATMLGMLVRMAVALGVVILFQNGGLHVAGVDIGRSLVGMIAVHYVVGLALGTWFCVRLVGDAASKTQPSLDAPAGH